MKRNTYRTLFTLAVLILPVLSCNDMGNPPESINDPVERWQSYNFHDYSIAQQRHCFCPGTSGWVLITVRHDAIVAISDLATGSPLPQELWAPYRSVEDLFLLVTELESFDQATRRVEYDPKFGLPTKVGVEYDPPLLDAGYSYETYLIQTSAP